MAVELIDVRAKVTPFGHCALIAHSRSHDVDISEIVRELIAGNIGELRWDEP